MALVITLLVVALITAMVVEFAYGVYVSTSSLHNWQTSQKLSVAARSAMKLAGRLISSGMMEKTKAVYEISQKIPYDDPEGTITVRIEDEGAKLNLNRIVDAADKTNDFWFPALQRLLEQLKLRPELADRIAWWINPRTKAAIGSPETAKNGLLDSVDELLLIPGMDRESYEKLRPYVTISGSGLVNINTASERVLMSLGLSPDMAKNIISYRELTPFARTSDLQRAGVPTANATSLFAYTAAAGGAYHITSLAESGGIKRVIEAVLDAGTIKFWREG